MAACIICCGGCATERPQWWPVVHRHRWPEWADTHRGDYSRDFRKHHYPASCRRIAAQMVGPSGSAMSTCR
jgi:hypothetical protein